MIQNIMSNIRASWLLQTALMALMALINLLGMNHNDDVEDCKLLIALMLLVMVEVAVS